MGAVRVWRLALLIAVWVFGCRGGEGGGEVVTAPTDGRPDILLITLDTLRADALGCYGHKSRATPTLDRLAAEGYRFSRAYTVAPLTIPAHSSLFTGLYPPRHGVRDNGDFFLDDGAVTLAELLQAEGYATMAAVGAEVTSHHWGFGQGFDAYHDDMGQPDPRDPNRWHVQRRGEAVVADARDWFAGRTDTGPWFAWVHLFDPHSPYDAPEPFASQHPGRAYVAEVAYTDAQVEALLQHLGGLEALDDTWIVVVGDHGEGLGSHGETMHGVLLYDATTRVPLIVRPPGGAASPRDVHTPVSLVDLMPTVLAAAGAPVPDGLDGEDVLPWLDDPAGDEARRSREVYTESLYAWRHYGWAQLRALVGPEHKYIDSTTPELYARSDRGEQQSLVADEAEVAARMKARLDERVVAMEPREEVSGAASLSAERLAQLEALGYITALPEQPPDPAEGLPDPVERLPVLADLEAARMAFQSDDMDEAARLVEAVVEAEPGLLEARVLRATVLWRQGRMDEALTALQQVDAEQPSTAAQAMIGGLLLHMDRTDEAVVMLQGVLDKDPYLAHAWGSYLHALLLSGDMSTLEREAARARRLLPYCPEAVGMEGVLLVQRGDLDQARISLEEALELGPDQPFAHHALGLVHRERGDVVEAEAMFHEEVKRFPGAVEARRMLVELYAEQRRYDEQLEQLEVIATLELPSVLTMHSRAQCLFNLRRFDEARTAVDECRAAATGYPACAMLEANVLKKLGLDAEAEQAFQRAVELAEGRAGGRRVD